MKKIGNLLKNNIKLLVGIVIGGIIFGGGVYAATVISSSNVGYTDTNSIGATTVQDAIDKLYTGITTYKDLVCPGCVYRKSTTTKYNVNSSSSSKTDANSQLSSSEYTTDYTTLNSNYFLGHVLRGDYIVASYACGINNGVFFCLRGVDSNQSSLTYKPFYEENVRILNKVFPSCNATTSGSLAYCSGDVSALVNSNGYVAVDSGSSTCGVTNGGNSYCA